MQRGHAVVEVVLEGVAHRFADVGEGGKVHDHIGPLVGEDPADRILVTQLGPVERHLRRDGGTVPEDEVIQHDGLMPGEGQLADAVTADVAGTPHNQDFHRRLLLYGSRGICKDYNAAGGPSTRPRSRRKTPDSRSQLWLPPPGAGHDGPGGLAPCSGSQRSRSTDIVALDDPEVAAALHFIQDHANEPIAVSDIVEEVLISRRASS